MVLNGQSPELGSRAAGDTRLAAVASGISAITATDRAVPERNG